MGRGTEQIIFQRRHRNSQQVHENVLKHHKSSGKCKPKPHRGITSHLLEWLSSKRQDKCRCGKNVNPVHCW